MDLLQLRYFYDSANYLSISKTAEKYGVPPTSVSASIRRLEKELGCKLFDRTANRISLNDRGKMMRDSLRNIFAEMDHMLQSVSTVADDTKEIKILVRAGRAMVTDQMIAYKKTYSHTRFKLVADFEETESDDYDIIVDSASDRYAGYQSVELKKQRILCYVPEGSDLCTRKYRLKQLAQMPFVVMGRRGTPGRIFLNACKNAGFSPNIVAQVNDSACFRKIISSGVAIGVSGKFRSAVVGDTTLVPLNITDFTYEHPLCMYFKQEVCTGNTARFISFLQENAKKETI